MMRREKHRWTLERKCQQVLLGLEAKTVNYMAKILASLENKLHFHFVLLKDSESDILTTELPRLELDFHSVPGSEEIFSRQFRGMYVDSNQRIGALIGLKSKLVLRNEANERKVLIPDGPPKWSSPLPSETIRVYIAPGTSGRIHCYNMDTLLQRMVDNGSLQSKLVICHLHALTSHFIPDEFTGTTGTEAAISILRSASLQSFDHFQKEDLQKLSKIANISPKREYYPKYLQSMETVHWDPDLSFLSQSNAFQTLVKSIITQVKATSFLYPGIYKDLPKLEHVNPKLGNRESIRAASFQVSGYGAENRSVDFDVLYQSRDMHSYSERSLRTFKIVRMLTHDQESLAEPVGSGLVDQIWNCLMGDTRGPTRGMPSKDICYDSQWLGDQSALIQKYWCSFHRLFAWPNAWLHHRFKILLCLATMAYSKDAQFQILQTIAAFAKSSVVGKVNIPNADYFRINEGRTALRDYIREVAKSKAYGFSRCPEAKLARLDNETDTQLNSRRYNHYSSNKERAIDAFVTSVYDQWLCNVPKLLTTDEVYVNTVESMELICQKWKMWYDNHLFYEYLCTVVAKLRLHRVVMVSPPKKNLLSHLDQQLRHVKSFIRISDILTATVSLSNTTENSKLHLITPIAAPSPADSRLMPLLERLKTKVSTKHAHQNMYIAELEKSRESLASHVKLQSLPVEGDALHELLCENERQCRANVDRIYAALCKATKLMPGNGSLRFSERFMSPRMSSSILLSNLARPRWQRLHHTWKKAIVMYGIAMTKLQHAKRLIGIKVESDLVKELSNTGHTNWDPLDHPETLLLEIESGILIREVQENIAAEMRSPSCEKNAVMQLNMGEGKSSVIVPIVAAHLADGSKRVRVIVGKPQAKELFRTLLSKLSGMLNRRIYHMPFNRSVRPTSEQVKALHALYKKCIKESGILLLQPEHILSFKLMTIEYQSLEGQENVGTALIDLQHFFDSQSRDIVDESDENFSPKFELVYTMGVQRPMELSPQRWTTIQRVLNLVTSIIASVQKEYPESVEITNQSRGSFPRSTHTSGRRRESIPRQDCQENLRHPSSWATNCATK